MKSKKYEIKKYKHFDNKIKFEKLENKIKNPKWIAKHSFYPFIHYMIKFNKYNKTIRDVKKKERDIYYSAHVDGYIYKYYGDRLNNLYNKISNKLDISDVAVAYRNNLDGKSNIHFAKEVIDFIVKAERAFIYVADFTSFFDKLEHKYLKEKIKLILGDVNTLPKDYYTIFKNITKFSYIEKEDVLVELKKKYGSREEELHLNRYFEIKDFREFKKEKIKTNIKNYGIPQGSAISAVLSNIYLLDFDKKINEYVKSYNGLYRRYCDDMIIVIPITESKLNHNHQAHIDKIEEIRKSIPNLIIQKEKTKKLLYINKKILDIELNFNESKLDYLGFCFNGSKVSIREKSVFKFYNRMYKKIKICNILSERKGYKVGRRSIYKKYSHLGTSYKKFGNFITYANRAQHIFDNDKVTVNIMKKQVKNHWKRLSFRLNNS